MNTLTILEIGAAVDAAFETTLAQSSAQRVLPQQIGDNATLRTDVYAGPKGTGFVVVATVDLKWRKLVISKQHGLETWRDRPAPEMSQLITECQRARAARYEAEASVYDLADAETKVASTDSAVQAEGAAQKVAVLAKRLEIKAAIPKPQ